MQGIITQDYAVNNDEHSLTSNDTKASPYLSQPLPVIQPPPPYEPSSPLVSPYEKTPSMDQLIYQKVLNLESMVSNIQGTVIDQNLTYKDVSTQLNEINQSMAKFQREASVRLRKKLTGSPYPRASSLFSSSSTSLCDDVNLNVETEAETEVETEVEENKESIDPLCEENEVHNEDSEDSLRYDRVCSLLENLLTDANSVLESKTPLPEEIALPEDDEYDFKVEQNSIENKEESKVNDNDVVDDSKKQISVPTAENEIKVEFYYEISRGTRSLRKHRLSKKFILPLVGECGNIDNDRLSALPAFTDPNNNEPIITEPEDGNMNLVSTSSKNEETFERERLIQQLAPARLTPVTFITLMYWSFLFCLGTILLDSTLCNMAGFQVLSILNATDKEGFKKLSGRRRAHTIVSPASSIASSPTEDKREIEETAPSPAYLKSRRKSF